MTGELNLLGVFVPALLVWAGLAFVLKEICCRLLLRAGAYELVWHRPLFDAALYVILLGGVVGLAAKFY